MNNDDFSENNNYSQEVNFFIDNVIVLIESRFKIKMSQLMRSTTGEIIDVYNGRNGLRCRVRINGSNPNGSEDLDNVPITTAQEVSIGNKVLINYSGDNLANAFVGCVIN